MVLSMATGHQKQTNKQKLWKIKGGVNKEKLYLYNHSICQEFSKCVLKHIRTNCLCI